MVKDTGPGRRRSRIPITGCFDRTLLAPRLALCGESLDVALEESPLAQLPEHQVTGNARQRRGDGLPCPGIEYPSHFIEPQRRTSTRATGEPPIELQTQPMIALVDACDIDRPSPARCRQSLREILRPSVSNRRLQPSTGARPDRTGVPSRTQPGGPPLRPGRRVPARHPGGLSKRPRRSGHPAARSGRSGTPPTTGWNTMSGRLRAAWSCSSLRTKRTPCDPLPNRGFAITGNSRHVPERGLNNGQPSVGARRCTCATCR